VPVALAKNVKHNHVVHTRTILLHFRAEDLPRIRSLEKIQSEGPLCETFRIPMTMNEVNHKD
jgi:K+ transporter